MDQVADRDLMLTDEELDILEQIVNHADCALGCRGVGYRQLSLTSSRCSR